MKPDAKQTLANAVAELRSQEGFKRWLLARKSFHSYSFRNTILIALQCPRATCVAGYRKWQRELGRQVRKGEKGIMILAPSIRKQPTDEDPDARVIRFRAVKVFDISQTDPIPGEDAFEIVPPGAEGGGLQGDSHAHWITPLRKLAEHAGYQVEWRTDMDPENGGYHDATAKKIALNSFWPLNSQVRALAHEIAHMLGLNRSDLERDYATCEVLADATAWIFCHTIGLDVSTVSVPYIATWHSAPDKVILAEGALIDAAVKQLVACNDDEGTETRDPAPSSESASQQDSGALHSAESGS